MLRQIGQNLAQCFSPSVYQAPGWVCTCGSLICNLLLVVICRVVAPGAGKVIGPHTFTNWGAHCDFYPCAYFTAAAAIGMRREEVDLFIKRLDKTFSKFKRRRVPAQEEVDS